MFEQQDMASRLDIWRKLIVDGWDRFPDTVQVQILNEAFHYPDIKAGQKLKFNWAPALTCKQFAFIAQGWQKLFMRECIESYENLLNSMYDGNTTMRQKEETEYINEDPDGDVYEMIKKEFDRCKACGHIQQSIETVWDYTMQGPTQSCEYCESLLCRECLETTEDGRCVLCIGKILYSDSD